MLKRRLLIPLVIGISFLLLYSFDRVCYRDKVPFLCPIQFEGKGLLIRCDSLGDGYFGAKRKNGKSHKGLDILAPVGEPVRAARSGWAISGEHPYGYGKFVKIAHSRGLATIYAHLKEVNLKWIKRVRQGDVIGSVGKTGNADHKLIKPHLHFEVRKHGVPQDPLKGYLE